MAKKRFDFRTPRPVRRARLTKHRRGHHRPTVFAVDGHRGGNSGASREQPVSVILLRELIINTLLAPNRRADPTRAPVTPRPVAYTPSTRGPEMGRASALRAQKSENWAEFHGRPVFRNRFFCSRRSTERPFACPQPKTRRPAHGFPNTASTRGDRNG